MTYELYHWEMGRYHFHGGCHGCNTDDVERCRGCQYYRGQWTSHEDRNTQMVHMIDDSRRDYEYRRAMDLFDKILEPEPKKIEPTFSEEDLKI